MINDLGHYRKHLLAPLDHFQRRDLIEYLLCYRHDVDLDEILKSYKDHLKSMIIYLVEMNFDNVPKVLSAHFLQDLVPK